MKQNKSIYFFITYFKKEKEKDSEIYFVEPEDKEMQPVCIYKEEIYENQFYYYNKIYKANKSLGKGKKGNNFIFKFEAKDEVYVISFDSKGCTFIYDVNIEVGKKIIDIRMRINKKKEYHKIMEFFLKALEKDEKDLIEDFYKETIHLYSIKKGFVFLIELFLKIYDKKSLFPELLKSFKNMNKNPKENAKNMDKPKFLEKYVSKFIQMKNEADKIIENNDEYFIDFYGIILCYLNYYNYENFSSTVDELNKKNANNLYEILLTYKDHFKNPIYQNLEFLNEFIIYTIEKKDFATFEEGLRYITDIETFISIIEKNKEKIFEKYNKEIIKLDELKFKKDSINKEIITEKPESDTLSQSSSNMHKDNDDKININASQKKNKNIFELIDNIKSLIKFCNNKNTFLIYFTNNFWQYILNNFNEPKMDNIYICFKLRELFKDYKDLVLKIFAKKDEKYTIKKEANIYFERDEFSIILDQIIREYNNNPDNHMTNIEKLAFITKYNPYYIEPKYSKKVDCNIFDSFDLNIREENEFYDFKKMNFEIIFKDNITDFIKKFMEKIKEIKDFGPVMKLINIDNIQDKDLYLKPLKIKFDNIIINEIGLLTDDKLNEAIHITAEIAKINYIYETNKKKLDFINERIKILDKKIISLIFIEIINIIFNNEEKDENEEEEDDNNIIENENKIGFKDDKEIDYNGIKEFIFEEFSNKITSKENIDDILNLIESLEKIDKKNKNEDKKLLNEFLENYFQKIYLPKKNSFLNRKI